MVNLKAKNLFGFKQPNWWVQEGDGCLLNAYYPTYSSSCVFGKYFPAANKVTLCFSIYKKFVWAYEAGEMIRIANKLISLSLKNHHYPQQLYRRWLKQVKDYYQIVNEINSLNLNKVPQGQFVELFNKFDRLYKVEYALPLLIDNYHEYAEKILLPKIQNYLKVLPAKNQERAYLALLSPSRPSFIKQAQWSVLQLAYQLRHKQNIVGFLKRHTQKYYWLHNNYTFTKYLDEKYWFTEVKKRLRQNRPVIIKREKEEFLKTKKAKDKWLKKLKIDRQTGLELKILDLFAYWQDQRKQANMIANWIIDQFLRALSRQSKVDYWLLKSAQPQEIVKLAKTGQISKDLLRRRLKFSVAIATPKTAYVLAYPEAKILYNRIFPKKIKSVKEIKGVAANRGIIKGRVKVITSSSQFSRFKKGEILAAAMTRPDYSVILHKASAIITDEGGLTCHAAIVSRELGIPCVIATKIATKALKDGMMVEVNANLGVVKVLSRR